MIPRLFSSLFLFLFMALSVNGEELFDLQGIRDVDSLEVRVVEDWRPHPKMPDIQQKLVEIVVAEWWKGQKVRIPVTLNLPTNSEQLPCQNVIVANMPLRVKMATPNGPAAFEGARHDHLIVVGEDFENGTIELELAGEPAPGASGGARGFAGVAFRVQEDMKTYDCFYLRPTNGRAND